MQLQIPKSNAAELHKRISDLELQLLERDTQLALIQKGQRALNASIARMGAPSSTNSSEDEELSEIEELLGQLGFTKDQAIDYLKEQLKGGNQVNQLLNDAL